MKNINLGIITTLSMFMVFGVAGAALLPVADQAKDNGQGPDYSPMIDRTASGEWDLVRVDFIHYAKPENPGNSGQGSKTESCYKLMGVKWKESPVNYVINSTNSGLSTTSVALAISASAETWDNNTSLNLFNNTYVMDDTAVYGVQNFENALDFGSYGDSNVIAVTSTWYTPRGKQIVEFDILFNTSFNWGDAAINPSLMDLRNIATHEIGHGIGLSDIYSGTCSAVTMYGYSTEGEINKRTLEQPDIIGLQRIYGI